jgi:hypothetical protein
MPIVNSVLLVDRPLRWKVMVECCEEKEEVCVTQLVLHILRYRWTKITAFACTSASESE